MERTVALKRLRKILGPKGGYTIEPKAISREERIERQAKVQELLDQEKLAGDAMRARMQHLLDNDPEYQQLKQSYGRAREARQDNSSKLLTYKITVGRDEGLFFRVDAQGDSWERIFEILKKRGKSL